MKKWILVLLGVGFLALALLYSNFKSPEYELCMGGNLFVVNKLDHTISIIDLANKENEKTIDIGIEPYECLLLKDGKTLVVSDFGNDQKAANEIFLISTSNFEISKTIKLENKSKLHGLALGIDPNILLVCSEETNSLFTVNLESGKIISETKTEGKKSHMVLAHPEKPIAYVSNIESNSISVINYELDSLIKTIKTGKGAEGLALSKNGKELWVSNREENSINILNTENFQSIAKLKTDGRPVRLAISPDSKFCVSSNFAGGNLNVFNTQTKELVAKVEFPGSSNPIDKFFNDSPTPAGLLFHPTKPFLFVSNSNADRAVIVSTMNWEIIGSWKVGDIPDGLALNVKPDDCP